MENTIPELNHTIVPISKPSNGKIIILNNGAVIGPEAEAMLQAMHSRSVGGAELNLMQIRNIEDVKKFMSLFYVGYNHKSIGDCGTITIFIEGVSMLVAKAVQDWALYSGQESSTRYIDFSVQQFVDPIDSEFSNKILEDWRSFYVEGINVLPSVLVEKFPNTNGEKANVYKKAINARAFDIMRGFLPAGATTNLAWHSNLRQVSDKIALLRHHPLEEVRAVAETLESALIELFPSSFANIKHYIATEEYNSRWMCRDYYFESKVSKYDFRTSSYINSGLLSEYKHLLSSRPFKTDLPKFLDECGQIQFEFLLDFGSFRDIQRHRAVTQRMPLVTTIHGFADWYLEELPADLRKKAENLLLKQKSRLSMIKLRSDRFITQYYTAMGYNLPNRVTGGLPALVYLVELRATRFVHPTLRKRAFQMGHKLEHLFEEFDLKIHFDEEPDMFDTKRGEHDIVKK